MLQRYSDGSNGYTALQVFLSGLVALLEDAMGTHCLKHITLNAGTEYFASSMIIRSVPGTHGEYGYGIEHVSNDKRLCQLLLLPEGIKKVTKLSSITAMTTGIHIAAS